MKEATPIRINSTETAGFRIPEGLTNEVVQFRLRVAEKNMEDQAENQLRPQVPSEQNKKIDYSENPQGTTPEQMRKGMIKSLEAQVGRSFSDEEKIEIIEQLKRGILPSIKKIFLESSATQDKVSKGEIPEITEGLEGWKKKPEVKQSEYLANANQSTAKIREIIRKALREVGEEITEEQLNELYKGNLNRELATEISPRLIGGAEEEIDLDQIINPALREFAENINRRRGWITRDITTLTNQYERLEELRDPTNPISQEQKDIVRRYLESKLDRFNREARREERVGFYLRQQDYELLRTQPLEWIFKRFDTLYSIAEEGQELSSPVMDNFERAFGDAVSYLETNYPQKLKEFIVEYRHRMSLISMRTTLGYRSMENIGKTAGYLGAHGLFHGFALEWGRVEALFSRYQELMEDERLKSTNMHVSPALVYTIQGKIIAEQESLAKLGISQIVDLKGNKIDLRDEVIREDVEKIIRENPDEYRNTEDDKKRVRDSVEDARKRAITRAVREAFDVFLCSQRQAVIVARGRFLTDRDDAYYSDPVSGPQNIYNMEDLLTEKFQIFTVHEQHFVKEIKMALAEDFMKKNKIDSMLEDEKEDLGRRLFRDFFAVPDFFSSGWRIDGITDSIKERCVVRYGDRGQEVAENLALFLRLKRASSSEEREVAWGKIAKYRPEEVVRIFRERIQADEVHAANNPELLKRINELFENDVFKNYVRRGFDEDGNEKEFRITNYDDFKSEFGAVIRELRNKSLREEWKQIDFSAGLTNEQKEAIDKCLGSGKSSDLQEMYRLMTEFANASTKDLIKNSAFADIYARTLIIDDAILGELERKDWTYEVVDPDGTKTPISKGHFVPLSKKYSTDQGADAYVRMWNDTAQAINAGKALVSFIKGEGEENRMKAAVEFAEAVSNYNGQGGRARSIRFTAGTYLNLSKIGYFWDIVGMQNLPFRKPISKMQEIFGPQAESLNRDQLQKHLDRIKHLLVAHAKDLTPEERKLSKAEQEEIIIKNERKAEEAYLELRHIFNVTPEDFIKLRAWQGFIFFLLALFGETFMTVKEAGKAEAKL